jgi:cyclase
MILKLKNTCLFLLMSYVCFSCADSVEDLIDPNDPDEPGSQQEHIFESHQLTSNIYIISEDYAGNKVNITVLTGDNGNLLIDAGFKNVCLMLKDSIERINSDPIKMIINTHYHPDHCGGNSIIDPEGTIIGHAADSYILEEEDSGAQIVTFTKEYHLDFNNEAISCYTLPQIGHLRSDIIIYFSTSNVLFLGDLYLPESFPSVSVEYNDASVQNWINIVEKIPQQFPADVVVVPGHGPTSSMKELIDYKDLMKSTVELVKSLIDQGKTYEEIIGDAVLSEWESYGNSLRSLSTEYWIKAIFESYKP